MFHVTLTSYTKVIHGRGKIITTTESRRLSFHFYFGRKCWETIQEKEIGECWLSGKLLLSQKSKAIPVTGLGGL
jgi:hypothetical protein